MFRAVRATGRPAPGACGEGSRVMSRWTLDSPTTLDFDGVVALRVRVIAGSVSGDLTPAEGRLGRVDAKTVSGRVTADVELAPAGEMRVGTVSGQVAIRLPAQASAQATIRSMSGHVHSDFDGLDSARGPGSK